MKASPFNPKVFILCTVSAFATSLYATTISLNSSAGETANNSGSATVNIPPNPSWGSALQGSSWVSYEQSGNPNSAGFISPKNGTIVAFTDTFTINGTPLSGSLMVMADDTASVILNGVVLKAFAPTVGNTYSRCSDFTIGCSSETMGTFNLLADLKPGVNTLTFDVEQVAGSSFGLDYAGSVSYAPAPEPATLSLLSLPLVAFGVIRRKRTA
jgi:hypothetical protein